MDVFDITIRGSTARSDNNERHSTLHLYEEMGHEHSSWIQTKKTTDVKDARFQNPSKVKMVELS